MAILKNYLTVVIYPQKEWSISLVYKNISSFIRNVVMAVCIEENFTMWRLTYLVMLLALMESRFLARTPPSPLRADVSTCWLLSERLFFWGRKSSALHIFWTPTHYSFSLSSRDSFPLSLVDLKTQVQHPVYEIHNIRMSKVNM